MPIVDQNYFNQIQNANYVQQLYGTGTLNTNEVYIHPGPVYNSKEQYYEALAKEVEHIWTHFDKDKCSDLQDTISKECKKILDENLSLMEGPLGPVYRLKPEAAAKIAAYLGKLVNDLLLTRVMDLLKDKAEELKKIAQEGKSSSPSDQSKPIAPLKPKVSQEQLGQYVWVPAGQMIAPPPQYHQTISGISGTWGGGGFANSTAFAWNVSGEAPAYTP